MSSIEQEPSDAAAAAGQQVTSTTQQAPDAADQAIDEDLQPFEISLYLPARPLLPTGEAAAGLPETPSPLKVVVNAQETLSDLRATITDSPEGYWLGAFCFRLPVSVKSTKQGNGKPQDSKQALGERLGEWIELREVFNEVPLEHRELYVAHVPFNEADARAHVQRLRELLSGGQADPCAIGIDAGISVHDSVKHPDLWSKEAASAPSVSSASKGKHGKSKEASPSQDEPSTPTPFLDWQGWIRSPMSSLIPTQARPPRAFPQCLRSLAVAPWNPPPQYLRIQGHLLYLQVGILEGENIYITASTEGFYVNRSNTFQFDPAPRDGQSFHSCSLFDVLCGYSKLFLSNFAKLFQDPVSLRDYLSVLPITNCLPAHPWLARVHAHSADPLRNQAAYLLTGATTGDALDGTRDWNDEIQSTRELPRGTLSERLVRDKVLNRTYAEFTLAATRAVPRVATGEVQAMNPMDSPDAHMFICNNLFISKGADGVDIYPHMGGDEAAHVAVGKDLQGIHVLNNLDVEGLCLLGTVVVDWKGERWVVQSVVPGLFRRRDDDDEDADAEHERDLQEGPGRDAQDVSSAGDNAQAPVPAAIQESSVKPGKLDPKEDTQVVYGGVEGPEVIRTDASFHKLFGQVARTLRLAEHEVPDAEGKKHSLWLSVDSKGLRGADGRKYALDLARLHPVDVMWLENDVTGNVLSSNSKAPAYPHRLTFLRQELIETYHDSEFRAWAREKLAAHQKEEGGDAETDANGARRIIEPSQFQLAFNTDAFVEFKATDGSDIVAKAVVTDESDPTVAAVRSAAVYLRNTAIPRLVVEVASGLQAAQDGNTLTRQLHLRGINMRYLGYIARLCEPANRAELDQDVLSKAGPSHEVLLSVYHDIVIHEMALRACKRILRSSLKSITLAETPACISHFLNCLLGSRKDAAPKPLWNASTLLPQDGPPSWSELTPGLLARSVREEVRKRFRYDLPASFFDSDLRKPQMLRELAQRCGFQLKLQEYDFGTVTSASQELTAPEATNGQSDATAPNGGTRYLDGKKKKKSASPAKTSVQRLSKSTTFEPEDVLHLIPVVKSSTPKSNLAEEAFETGRINVTRGDRTTGFELLLEGISFHEQVYGIVHPQVARCYSIFATITHHFASLALVEHEQQVRQAQAEGKEAPPAPEISEHLNLSTAVRYQRQAVTLSERTLGLDHPETLTQWQNLSILERADGEIEASLRCSQRVLGLFDIIHGGDHPEIVSVLSNTALTLQNARMFVPSLKVYSAAHELALKLYGADSLHSANLAHEVSQAHTFQGDLKSALAAEKEAVRVFESIFGKEHSQTRESQSFLSSLTASAVHMAKVERERALNGRNAPRAAINNGPKSRQQPVTPAGPSNAAAEFVPSERKATPSEAASIDDLVAYISGTAPKGKGKAIAGSKRAKHSS